MPWSAGSYLTLHMKRREREHSTLAMMEGWREEHSSEKFIH